MDDSVLDELFSGDLNRLLPLPKRVVRLFISSTFTDMMLERNSLMERVYPRLKKYCRERHGLDFQVVDMRWGVRDEATDDHQTANLCSREIDNCKRMSLGPQFVALLGDKYGFRPLCNKIKSTEYRALRRCLIELDISTDLLDTWYREDLNAIPAEHLLQPISSILKNFTNRNEPDLQSMDQKFWMAIQERLYELLMIGSKRLVEQGKMSEQEQLMRYSISVTEREVIEGCLDVNDAKSSCLVYVRSITNLVGHLERLSLLPKPVSPIGLTRAAPHSSSSSSRAHKANDSQVSDKVESQAGRRASIKIGDEVISLTGRHGQSASERRLEKARKLIGKFVDLKKAIDDETWLVDQGAQVALANLKECKLEAKLKNYSKSLTKYKVLWDEQEGLSLKSEEHRQYLNELNEHFYANITRMIRKAGKNEQVFKSGLIGEVLQHSHYAKHVSKSFHGRSEELDRIRAYILHGLTDDGSSLPMFVYGVGGSGKTSVLARAATSAKEWILSSKRLRLGKTDEHWVKKPCIIMRFCCTTPSSSSMVGVLTSVCHQLQFNFYQYGPMNGATIQSSQGSESQEAQLPCEPIPEDLVRLVFKFRQLLDNCQHHFHRQRLFLIILDAVERLDAPGGCSIQVKYSWLTSLARFPANVRLIVSCSSELSNEGDFNRAGSNSDYRYLKRYFLRLYLPFRRSSKDVSGSHSRSDSDNEELSSEQAACIGSNYSALNSANLEEKRSERRLTQSQIRLNWMKKLMIPTVRFRRGTQHTTGPSDSLANQNESISSEGPNSGQEVSKERQNCEPVGLEPSEEDTLAGQPAADPLPKGPLTADSGPGVSEAAHVRVAEPKKPSPSSPTRPEIRHQTIRHKRPRVWIIHVRPMGVELALSVLQRWLAELGRCLSQQQWLIVRKSVSACSRPIFVKLAFGEIINWKSYSVQGDSSGLTFGSSLLESCSREMEQAILSDTRWTRQSSPHLASLLASCRHSGGPAAEALASEHELKVQILSMEQQWLNFLDYRRLRDNSTGSDSHTGNLTGATSSGVQPDTELKLIAAPKSGRLANLGASSICHLSNTIEAAICQLFGRIELQHGYLLTKHSLSYITAARNGICENELEDILSLDDVVLDDVFQYHLPPVRRIPPLLWTRIRNDLSDYLSERDADGIVINWHHGQFKDVALRRYMSEQRQQLYIHSNLADYFLGRWADQPKPFRCTKQQVLMAAEQLESAVQQSIRDSQNQAAPSPSSLSASRLSLTGGSISVPRSFLASFGGGRSRLRSSSSQHDQRLQWIQARADRRVPHQPLHYPLTDLASSGASGGHVQQPSSLQMHHSGRNSSEQVSGEEQLDSGARRYNMRKLTELPYHLIHSARYLDLANSVLFNYKWLYAALDASGLQCLLADFDEAELSLREALRQAEQSLPLSAPAAEKDPHPNGQPTGPANKMPEDAETISTGTGAEPWGAQELSPDQFRAIIHQLRVLTDTIRLSCSALHSNTRMLAPQLIGRLLPLIRGHERRLELPYLVQLLEQCDQDGSLDCALLPMDHCLQAPDGLLLSSLEGHSFGVMSMLLSGDQRHLLAASNRFIMWDIATGEVVRDLDPQIEGSIVRAMKLTRNGQRAVAYTSNNLVLAIDLLTQQMSKFKPESSHRWPSEWDEEPLIGLELVERAGVGRFVTWTRKRWFAMQLESGQDGGQNKNMGRSFKSSMQAQSMKIRLLYMMESPVPDRAIIWVQQVLERSGCELALLLMQGSPTGDSSLEFITGQVRHDAKPGGAQFQAWPQRMRASALALDPSLSQLVYSDPEQANQLFLSRRRCNLWSRPRLLWGAKGETEATTVWDDGQGLDESEPDKPLALELEVSRDRICKSTHWKASQVAPRRRGEAEDGYKEGDEPDFRQQEEEDEEEREGEEEGEEEEEEEEEELAQLEIQVDGLQDDEHEIKSHRVFEGHRGAQGSARRRPNRARLPGRACLGLGWVKVYLGNRILVLKLDEPMEEAQLDSEGQLEGRRLGGGPRVKWQRSLALPRRLRNISVEPNASQIRAVILDREGQSPRRAARGPAKGLGPTGYLVAAAGRQLLVYSLENGQFLRCIEAHQARIMELIALPASQTSAASRSSARPAPSMANPAGTADRANGPLAELRRLAVASGSLDKTVKTWNLSNLDKDSYTLDRLDGGIRAISLAGQRPLAATLGRTELGLWDWASMRLLVRLGPSQLGDQSRLLTCRLAEGAALLALASRRWVQLWRLDEAGSGPEPAARWAPSAGYLVRRLRFLHSDSRLLSVLEWRGGPGSEPGPRDRPDEGPEERPTRPVMVQCHSAPHGQLLFAIQCETPSVGAARVDQHYLAPAGHQLRQRQRLHLQHRPREGQEGEAPLRRPSTAAQEPAEARLRLPVLTRDQLHLVSLESEAEGPHSASEGARRGGRASLAALWAPVLAVYSARDGAKLRRIQLNRLELGPESVGRGPLAPAATAFGGGLGEPNNRFANLGSACERLGRLKSVRLGERHSVVALLPDEPGCPEPACIIDVQSQRLLNRSQLWDGKLSRDGAFGLSRPFRSASLRGAGPQGAGQAAPADGLHLLEMGRCSAVKLLLGRDRLARSSPQEPASGQTGLGTGHGRPICGFLGPHDSHVYFRAPGSDRLLLVELAEARLVADYSLASPLLKLKRSPDGFVLVLGLADGSLTSLALADPSRPDTMAVLAESPSRAKP